MSTPTIATGTKPAVVLVHGFWGGAAHWTNLVTELHSRGYDDLHAVEIPLTSLADDAERTAKMIKQIDGPVILVGHSYGGAVITEAGDLPNVAGLVYVAAFAPDAGESAGQLAGEFPPAAFDAVVPDSDGYLWVQQDRYQEAFAADLDAKTAFAMAVTQKAPLGSTFGDTVTEPAWKAKPSYYQVSAADRMINPDNERRMADRIGARKVVELDSSHASLASHPIEIADLIDDAVADLSA
jgi:pimeloyl-ACP methyl ester carboxylesterase